ncbi:MAG: glycosyltransferase [Bacteroidota bacterium]|nr:glycosyltransferase [Bacteroidota bacterium]
MILVAAFIILYTILIAALCVGFFRWKPFLPEHGSTENPTCFSVIIPFRNEAKHLQALLESLNKLTYNKEHFEVLLVNDASTDASLAVIEAFQNTSKLLIRVLDNERFSASPKKDALTKGISQAKFEWIITTDADCTVAPGWLAMYHQAISQKSELRFIAGPVLFSNAKNSLLGSFQQLDFLSLQGATIGSFGLGQAFMCNGANLAFAKTQFQHLNGYQNTDHIASGDDVFLMQKFIKNDAKQVGYLKTSKALVMTAPQPHLAALIAQRKRWAAKASAYTSAFAVLTAIVVFTGNLAVLLLPFYASAGWFSLLKVGIDVVLITQTAREFNQKKPLWHLIWVVFVYPFFTVCVALASQTGSFVWKGRTFKK